jgi:SAM-dependent methyltransferase
VSDVRPGGANSWDRTMRTECRACNSADLEVMLDFGDVPLAGGFLAGDADVEREQRYPLVVHVCRNCALVQILEPVDPEVLFQDYSFSSSTVAGLVKHFDDYAAWLVERFRPDLVVEFGCNDGVLLAPLERAGVRAVGIDVSENITELARERGHDVLTGFFDRTLAERIRAERGEADIVTGSNVFAHNDRPEAILDAARVVLKPDGKLCLEVMYAGDLYEQIQWDTLYHEHLTFYALHSLRLLLERNGFRVLHVERIPMHGGSLRVVATPGEAHEDPSVDTTLAHERELGIVAADTWHAFADDARRTISVVSDVIARLSDNATIWGYGAAGKATMWVNLCRMTYLGGMVDASPLRAGKLMPGTHTPIVLPEEFQRTARPDFVFVTAWNYLDAIRRNEDWYDGTWVTPLPSLSFT